MTLSPVLGNSFLDSIMYLRCDTFYIGLIDSPEQPSNDFVHCVNTCTYKNTTAIYLFFGLFAYLACLNVPGYWIVRAPFPSLLPANPFPFLIFSPLSSVLNLFSSCFDN